MRLTTWIQQEVSGLFNLLLPPACALCLNLLEAPDADFFCTDCSNQIIPLQQPCCPRCALPYPAENGHGHLCQTCLQENKILFSGVTAIGPYDGLLREAIHRFKYRNDINLDRPLGALLARKVQATNLEFDLIIPVPLHKSKLRRRTYNQSALLSRMLSRVLGIASATDLLIRTRPDPPQKEMAAHDRVGNVKKAFAVQKSLRGAKVLLVDDVMTTGATARECSRILNTAGAASVHVAILARAPLR